MAIPKEIHKLHAILTSFLGESRNPLDETYQCQFPCPMCVENKGEGESDKFNLEVNLRMGVFQCWSCSQTTNDMKGPIFKLIRKFGGEQKVREYKATLNEFRESNMYMLNFSESDFRYGDNLSATGMELPKNYRPFKRGDKSQYKALSYLFDRGVGWDIIDEYKIGVTSYSKDEWRVSNRIVIPSFDRYGDLNYWTGRDFTGNAKQKYYNPKAERMNLIFNEDKIQWDADVTLVEGPFDHIVVPNSIPLLGKALDDDYKIYREVMSRCNAKVNVFLDGDARDNTEKVYRLLDQGRLKGKVRAILPNGTMDPSEAYKTWGKRGICYFLGHGVKL